MEDKIEIKETTTVEELTEIIMANDAAEVAEAFFNYMTKQMGDWYKQYRRADVAEKELSEIKSVLVKFAISQIEKEIDKNNQ